MQGHAAANMTVLASSNRIGVESGKEFETQFYGGSFIANHFGTKRAEAGEVKSEVVVQTVDLDEIAEYRRMWGIFRTRRTDIYTPLCEARVPEHLMDPTRP